VPIRDVNDIAVAQTAILGEANVLCSKDQDFHDEVMREFLGRFRIAVMDDVSFMKQLRSGRT